MITLLFTLFLACEQEKDIETETEPSSETSEPSQEETGQTEDTGSSTQDTGAQQ